MSDTSFQLDERQRAMLREMGVAVWMPDMADRPEHAAANANANANPSSSTHPNAVANVSPAAVVSPVRDAPAVVRAPHNWSELVAGCQNCRACSLSAGRKNSSLRAPAEAYAGACDWMVVVDAPDQEEDRLAMPCPGAEGVLLNNIARNLGLQRVNAQEPPQGNAQEPRQRDGDLPSERRLYVTNAVKCRPPHGVLPQPADLQQCSHWLAQELALVKPRIIIALGRDANQLLLGPESELPLGKLRGRVHRYQGIPVVVSYPPGVLMRNNSDKAKAWQDWCLAAHALQA